MSSGELLVVTRDDHFLAPQDSRNSILREYLAAFIEDYEIKVLPASVEQLTH